MELVGDSIGGAIGRSIGNDSCGRVTTGRLEPVGEDDVGRREMSVGEAAGI